MGVFDAHSIYLERFWKIEMMKYVVDAHWVHPDFFFNIWHFSEKLTFFIVLVIEMKLSEKYFYPIFSKIQLVMLQVMYTVIHAYAIIPRFSRLKSQDLFS